MTPDEHIDALCEFLCRCADRQREAFKNGGTAYQNGQADALMFSAHHLRETWKTIKEICDANP